MSLEDSYEPSPCPDCGAPSRTVVYRDGGREIYRARLRCPPCGTAYEARCATYREELAVRFSSLPERTRNCLARSFGLAGSLKGLLAMRDDELLAIRNFGPKALAEFRAVVPAPIPRTDPAPGGDPERFWAARPDILSVVGG